MSTGTFVLFFGGYWSSLINIKEWTASAIKQMPNVMFDGYPYPDGAKADGEEGVKAFKNPKTNDYAKAIKKIEDSKSDVIYIVGHSSGCAIANAVDEGLKDHSKIILVALDGFVPSAAQLARPSTQVWVAEGDSTGKSLNHDRLLKRINDFNLKAKPKTLVQVNVYMATNCTKPWPLHFSLVNLSSSDTLVHYVPDGYKNCEANLIWI